MEVDGEDIDAEKAAQFYARAIAESRRSVHFSITHLCSLSSENEKINFLPTALNNYRYMIIYLLKMTFREKTRHFIYCIFH